MIANSDETVLDQTVLDQLVALGGGPDLVARLAQLYLETAPALLQTLQDAAVNDDVGEVKTAAHTLKSSSANVGAKALSDMCQRIEKAAAEGNLAPVSQDLEEAPHQFQRVQVALKAIADGA
jgi:HPt (histidine-containing phosphotransfer) domain-containing protein